MLNFKAEDFVFHHCSVYTLQNIYPIIFDYFTFFINGRNILNKLMITIFKKFQVYLDAMAKKPVDLSKHLLVWMHNESKTQKSSDENLIVEIYNREQIRDLKKS